MLTNNFITTLTQTKSRIDKLSTQIASQSKIQKPSDSPSGTIRLNRLYGQLSQSDSFNNNIQNGLAFVNSTILSMETIQNETSQTLTKLTELVNATNGGDFTTYADAVDLSLNAILDAANTQSDGKYIFGGTDFSTSPFGLTADGSSVEVKASDISGTQEIKISPNISQKLNMSGTEVFGTIVKGIGSLNKDGAIGDVSSAATKVYDAAGNQYTLNMNYTKSAENTYSLSYDIVDGSGTSVYSSPPAAKELVYDADTGKLSTIDGSSAQQFSIKVPDKKIDFMLNINGLNEKSGASSLAMSANQQMDIFNTLILIRDNLRKGIPPTEAQRATVSDFNKHMLAKLAESGSVSNQFTDVSDQLTQQKTILQELVSKEQDVDIAKAIMEMQTEDNALQMSYKLSAMIMPQSLLNYL